MSQLLRTIVGNVIPEIPLQDEVPVPYRPTLNTMMSRTSMLKGSQPVEPREAVMPPISEEPT